MTHIPDRWEIGFRNIVTAVLGARKEFEIPEIVQAVKDLVADKARLDWLERAENPLVLLYFDDGTMIDTRGLSSRAAIDSALAASRPGGT